MSPIYMYVDTETGELFEEIRKIKDRDKPFISPDGKKCKRVQFPTGKNSFKGWKKDKDKTVK